MITTLIGFWAALLLLWRENCTTVVDNIIITILVYYHACMVENSYYCGNDVFNMR